MHIENAHYNPVILTFLSLIQVNLETDKDNDEERGICRHMIIFLLRNSILKHYVYFNKCEYAYDSPFCVFFFFFLKVCFEITEQYMNFVFIKRQLSPQCPNLRNL